MVIKSVSLDPEYKEVVEDYIEGFSGFVNDCLREKFMDEDYINSQIKEYRRKIKILEKFKKKLIKFSDLGKDEKSYIIESNKKIKENKRYLRPRYRYFCREFGRVISLESFRRLLEYGN